MPTIVGLGLAMRSPEYIVTCVSSLIVGYSYTMVLTIFSVALVVQFQFTSFVAGMLCLIPAVVLLFIGTICPVILPKVGAQRLFTFSGMGATVLFALLSIPQVSGNVYSFVTLTSLYWITFQV